MAKIRLDDFGQRVAPVPDRRRVPVGALVRDDSAALNQLTRAAGGLLSQERSEAERLARQQEAESNQRAAELRRAKGVEAYAGFQADMDDLTDNLAGRLSRNEVKRDELPEMFSKELEDLKKRRLEGLDQEQQAGVGAHFMTAERRARLALRKAMDVNQREERLASVNGAIENFHRLGVKEPERAIRQANILLDTEGPGLLGADKVSSQKQAFAERVYYTHFAERLNFARNDARGLAKLEGDIVGNQVMDPDRKNVLLGRVKGMQESLAAAADRAEKSRLATLQAEISRVDELILKGYEPSAEQMGALLEASKGTPYEDVVRGQIAFNRQTAQFSAASPRTQEATINDLDSQVRARPTPDGVNTLERYKSIHQAQQNAVRADPISFAAQRNLAAVQPLDLQQPASLGDQLKARLDISRGMKATYGSPLQVLTREEASTISRFLAESTTEAKAGYLTELTLAIPDRDAYSVLMRQIAPDSPVTAVAGALLGKDRNAVVQRNLIRPNVLASPREVAGVILEGERLLNPSRADKAQDGKPRGFPMPKEEDFKRSFSDQVGRAFAGDAAGADVAYQAVKAYYAGQAAREGDVSGELDNGRLQRSLRAVTGGVTNFNGRGEVLLPWGMDESAFKNEVRRRFPGAVKAAGLPDTVTDMLPALGLQQSGDGRYLVRSGSGYLLGKDGRPVELKLYDEPFRDEQGRVVSRMVPQ